MTRQAEHVLFWDEHRGIELTAPTSPSRPADTSPRAHRQSHTHAPWASPTRASSFKPTTTTDWSPTKIYADTTQADWGTLTLRNVTTVGQVAIIAADEVCSGHVFIDGLTVRAADLRGRVDRPRGFGVEAMQGALTVWNRQADASVHTTAEITNVAAGSEGTPARGSGVFVGGHGTDDGKASGGVLAVTTLSTGEICTDGGIAEGTPDLISGGVFVISGARVENVINDGPVTTLGQNDMVLDNWGNVIRAIESAVAVVAD